MLLGRMDIRVSNNMQKEKGRYTRGKTILVKGRFKISKSRNMDSMGFN